MAQAVKRACDACHRRKVKCDGVNPCKNCQQAALTCTYNAIPQKKGPKGSRAKVISELRETQRQTSLFTKVHNHINGMPAPTNPGQNPTPGLLTLELVKDCVNFFFDYVFPQLPILDRAQVEQDMRLMEHNRDGYCLLTSLCALVMLQPGMSMPTTDPYNLDMNPAAMMVASQLLLDETLRVRQGQDYLDNITPNTLATNIFIMSCYYNMEMHEKAWYYLREATTMVHMIGMHKEENLAQYDAVEVARRRRTYWLLLLLERAYAIQRHKPTTLQATIQPPGQADLPALGQQLSGFTTLINLFQPLDDAFLASWAPARASLTVTMVHGLQKQLNELAEQFLRQNSDLADFGTNQQWLKSTVWQMKNQYPVDAFLMSMAAQVPKPDVDASLMAKVIETCSSLVDYLEMQPPSRDRFSIGPHEHLKQILAMVGGIRTGNYQYTPLLLSKISEVLPRLITPILPHAPENLPIANIDMFDGFGTTGMVQPHPQAQFPMEADYGHNLAAEEYERKYAMDMNGGTPESATHSNPSNGTPPGAPQGGDMTGQFVNSPNVMSPGMEYPHGMNNFTTCAPIGDMVMSPLGNPAQSAAMHGMQVQGQHQHPQHMVGQHVNQGHDSMQMANLAARGLHNGNGLPASQSMSSMNTMYGMRQQAQRQGSFQLPAQPPTMRSMSDFQGIPRSEPEGNPAMGGFGVLNGGDMDFVL